MGVFVVRNGCRLPLHDHPGMHGMIKILHGTVNFKSYSLVEDDAIRFAQIRTSLSQHFTKPFLLVQKHDSDKLMGTDSNAIYLTPKDGNYHELIAVDGPAVFFDVLSPSYDIETGTRPCNYYRELTLPPDCLAASQESLNLRLLISIPPPREYWSNSAQYSGPSINPYDHVKEDVNWFFTNFFTDNLLNQCCYVWIAQNDRII